MPTPLLAEANALIDRPNFAHLATLMSDGSPHSVPVWVGRDGDRLLVCTSEGSLKGRNTRRDPRVALSIVDFHNPYEEVQLRGRVVEPPPLRLPCPLAEPTRSKQTELGLGLVDVRPEPVELRERAEALPDFPHLGLIILEVLVGAPRIPLAGELRVLVEIGRAHV